MPSVHSQNARPFWRFALYLPLAVATATNARADEPSPKASKPNHQVKVEFDRRIPMRDGVTLSADIYRPDARGRFPVILSRTPYLKSPRDKEGLERCRYFAARGYVVVVADVRGRGDSGGTFVPYIDEGRDGFDAIEWCSSQVWSTGKVATQGGSYTAKNQWLAAIEQPPHLAAMVAMVTPSDPFVEWPTGVPIPIDISWHHFTAGHMLVGTPALPEQIRPRESARAPPFGLVRRRAGRHAAELRRHGRPGGDERNPPITKTHHGPLAAQYRVAADQAW
jgi:predicted acyl esterase